MAGLALELAWKPAAWVLTRSSRPALGRHWVPAAPAWGGQDSSALAGEPSALRCPPGGRGHHRPEGTPQALRRGVLGCPGLLQGTHAGSGQAGGLGA